MEHVNFWESLAVPRAGQLSLLGATWLDKLEEPRSERRTQECPPHGRPQHLCCGINSRYVFCLLGSLSRTCTLVGIPQAQEGVYRSQWSSRPKLCPWAMRTEADRVCQTPGWPQISQKWEKALMSLLWLIHQNKWNSTQLSQFWEQHPFGELRPSILFFLYILIPV